MAHVKITSSSHTDMQLSKGTSKAGKPYEFYKAPAKLITVNDGDEETEKCVLTVNAKEDLPAPGIYDLNLDKALFVDRFGGIGVRVNRSTLVPRK